MKLPVVTTAMARISVRGRRHGLMSEINVVPYIDVMLVLLIIFMITAPLLEQGVEIDLPDAAAEPVDTGNGDDQPLIVKVDSAGAYSLTYSEYHDEPMEAPRLVALVQAVLEDKPHVRVLVRGDERADYGSVVRVMAMLKVAGVPRVGLLTEEPAES